MPTFGECGTAPWGAGPRPGPGRHGDPHVAVRPPLRTACGSEPGRTCGRCGHQRGPVVTLLAYRFALDPTPAQERALRSHAGAARVAFNWGLARVKERYEAECTWYSATDLHKL